LYSKEVELRSVDAFIDDVFWPSEWHILGMISTTVHPKHPCFVEIIHTGMLRKFSEDHSSFVNHRCQFETFTPILNPLSPVLPPSLVFARKHSHKKNLISYEEIN
jgi:hypothetical protein